MSKGNRIVDIKFVDLVHHTDGAWLILFEEGEKAIWIPKSMCEVDEDDKVVSMKESVAIDKEIDKYIE